MRKSHVPGHKFDRFKNYLDMAQKTAGVVTSLVQAGRTAAPYIRAAAPYVAAAAGAL